MNISPARAAAFDVLFRIETDKAFSSVLLPIVEENLSPSDRSLCHELVLGTLRRQIYLDRVIDEFSSSTKLDVSVRIALRLALYQLFYLDRVPQYSAINESVNLVQRAKKTSAKGFVNAILRRAVREKVEFSHEDEIERISVETSHPKWLIEKWTDEFGRDEAALLAVANNYIPDAAFRIIRQSGDRNRRTVESARKSAYVEGCYIPDAVSRLPLALRSDIYFQDEASQMVANAVQIPQGGRVMDVCAAPGGKTGMIATRGFSMAASVTAGDFHWPRVEFLRDNVRRQGADLVSFVQYNAEISLPFELESFDSVLVDAPCSGTGTIRRNPEIRYFLQPSDFLELPKKQLSILTNASKLVKESGSLLFSTCSLEREENEGVCNSFLVKNKGFEIVKPNVPDRFITSDGFARTWPHRDNMDGFFMAAFRRR